MSDGYEMPDDATVENAVAQLQNSERRKYFFARLDNPLWFEPLRKKDFFHTPSEIRVEPDGTLSSEPWPEGVFLLKVAETEPVAVADILERVGKTNNFDVRTTVIAALEVLPPKQAARLVENVVPWLEDDQRLWIDPIALSRSATRLIENNRAQSLDLFDAMYGPRSVEAAGPHGSKVTTGLETHWYNETLPSVTNALVQAFGTKGLERLVVHLDSYMQATELPRGTEGDSSYAWRPNVDRRDHDYDSREIGNALVDAVRDASIALVNDKESFDDVLSILAKSKWNISQRIALYVLGASGVNEWTRSMGIERLLDRNIATDYKLRSEFTFLGQTFASELSIEEEHVWLEIIDERLPDEKIERILSYGREHDDHITVDEIENYRERDILQRLTDVGDEHLGEVAKSRLVELRTKHGTFEKSKPYEIQTFVGTQSPISAEDLAKLTPPEVIEYLSTWKSDKANHGFGPTPEGLGHQLQSDVSTRPTEYAEVADRFIELDPTYVRSMLSGLESAIREGRTFATNSVLSLIMEVARIHTDDTEDTGSDWDSDPTWQWSQRQAASLIDSIITLSEITLDDDALGITWAATELLLNNENPSPEYEAQYGGTNMDPVTLSLNTVRPDAVRAAVHLLDRVEGASPSLKDSMRRLIFEKLDHIVNRESEPSLAVRSAVGETILTIHRHDPEWIGTRVSKLAGNDDQSTWDEVDDVIWTTAFARWRPHPNLFAIFEEPLVARLQTSDRHYEPTPSWRHHEKPWSLVAEHLFNLLITNVIKDDFKVLRIYESHIGDEQLGHDLGHLGWALGRANSVDDFVRNQAMALWDRHMELVRQGQAKPERLRRFAWWVQSGLYPIEWWLPRLEHIVNLVIVDERLGLAEALLKALPDEPDTVFNVFATLIDNPTDKGYRDFDLIQSMPNFIKAGLDSSDGDVSDRANRLRDRLGREGYTDLNRQIRELGEDQ